MFKKQLPIIFIGLSIVVAVLVLGWSVFVKREVSAPVKPPVIMDDNNQNSGSDEFVDDSSDMKDDAVVDDNDISEVDTSDWKTYRDEEYGFEIKYPENWELIYLKDFYSSNNGVVLKSSDYQPIKDGNVMHKGEIYIHGMDNQNNLSIEDLFSTFSDSSVFWFDKFDHTDIIVNGNNGVLFDYIMEDSPSLIPQNNIKRIGAYIQGDKKVIDISYLFLENPKREIFNKILYSFDFVDPNNSKTFQSDRLKISFEYPMEWQNLFEKEGDFSDTSILHSSRIRIGISNLRDSPVVLEADNGGDRMGRGGFTGDIVIDVNSQEYIKNFCQKNKNISKCEYKTNLNNINFVKYEDELCAERGCFGKGLFYLTYNPNSEYRGVLLYTYNIQKDKVTPSSEEEIIFDSLVDSLEFIKQ